MLTGDNKNTTAGITAGKGGSNDRFGSCVSEQLFFFSRVMPQRAHFRPSFAFSWHRIRKIVRIYDYIYSLPAVLVEAKSFC